MQLAFGPRGSGRAKGEEEVEKEVLGSDLDAFEADFKASELGRRRFVSLGCRAEPARLNRHSK